MKRSRAAARASAATTALTILALTVVLWAVEPDAPTGAAVAAAADPPSSELAAATDVSPAQSVTPAQVDAPVALPDFAADALCGDPRLAGEALEPIETERGCRVDRPILLEGAAGVDVAPDVVLGCDAAIALADWIESSVRPEAVRRLGAPPATIRQVSGYVCRTVNNVEGAPLSRHALGRAIDVAAVILEDGTETRLYDAWGRAVEAGDDAAVTEPAEARGFWSAVWDDACGGFTTVLGPNADIFHRDHLHLDVARRRGAFCR